MYQKESPSTIQSMFNSIANRYDLTNSVLSLSLHKIWNRTLVKQLLKRQPSASTYIDLCSGTGDIAFEYLKKASPCQASLIDFSSEMLAKAKKKEPSAPLHKISYMEGDVQDLQLSNDTADCASMAYGLRNVQNPALCISEVFRVLKPGGSFGILELTRPSSFILRMGHRLYLKTFIPLFGKLLTNNQQAYQYLCKSIENFIEPIEIENMMKKQGFIQTKCYPLVGGVATIIIGNKDNL